VGGLIPLPVRVAVGMVLALTLVAAPLVLPRRVPQLDRETDQNLLSRGPYVWALANGALLGAGFTSRIGYWIWYLVPLGCVIAGSPGLGALIWAGYGFTRLGIAAGLAYRLVHEPDRMADLQQGDPTQGRGAPADQPGDLGARPRRPGLARHLAR
jgi:hypothetical protein